MTHIPTAALETTAARLSSTLNAVYDSLDALARIAAPIFASAVSAPQTPVALETAAHRMLDTHPELLTCVGISVAPEAFDDAANWMRSWERTRNGIELTLQSLNAQSMSYYDYTRMEWFHRPSTLNAPMLVGPFMDFGSTDRRIVTAGLPFPSRNGTVSVAAADIGLDQIERILLQTLDDMSPEVALVAESGSVIASNSARLTIQGIDPVVTYTEIAVTGARREFSWRLIACA